MEDQPFYALPPFEVLNRGCWTPSLEQVIVNGKPTLRPKSSKFGLAYMIITQSPSVNIFGRTFTVPVGFETDGGSIPRLARIWFDSWGRGALGAIIHDYLLRLKDLGVLDWDKWQIDWILYSLMKVETVPDFEAMIKFLAVRTKK